MKVSSDHEIEKRPRHLEQSYPFSNCSIFYFRPNGVGTISHDAGCDSERGKRIVDVGR